MAADSNGRNSWSKGTLGLPHYRSSRISTSLAEPIYLNLFTVQLTPPAALASQWDEESVNLMLEGVQDIQGLNSDIFPGGAFQQKYKHADRSFIQAVPSNTFMDITINFALNMKPDSDTPDNFTYKFLRQWNDLVYDPMTGRTGLKKNYVAPNVVITMQDREGVPFWQWILYNVFPTKALEGPGLSYTANEPMKASLSLRCDYWDECML